MPAARGVKRSASKTSASTASSGPKNKKKRGGIQLEIPSAPKKKGCILTCGQGDVGQLGLGEDIIETTKFKQVASLPNKMVDVCAGGMHTIALDSDGKVWTWGCNDEGALGRTTSGDSDEGRPTIVILPSPALALSAGDSHSAALLNDGNVYAWGSFRDSHGSMGLVLRGREGKACREPFRLPLPETAVAIASGGDHLAILTTSGCVYTMGCGEQGQLGRLAQRSASRDSRHGLSALLVPTKVTLKGGASRIWAGYHATFILDATGDRLLAWGLNNYGQLGISGATRQCALYAPAECDAFPARTWRRLAPGQHHTLALDSAGAVWAVGRCEYGRLGLGDRTGDAETPEQIPKLQDKKCISIAAGTSNSFAVTDAGEVFAWGMGSEGQLGTGGTADAPEPAPAALAPRRARAVAAGGQHTAVLAEDPTVQKEEISTPEEETQENKVEDTEDKDEPEEEVLEEKKPRPAKRQKKQEQDEEISSTSSTQLQPTDEPDKVNGDEKKNVEMEVDEPNNETQIPEPENKDDKQTEEPIKETEPEEPESEKESVKEDVMDTSSQDTAESDDQPAGLNGQPTPTLASA